MCDDNPTKARFLPECCLTCAALTMRHDFRFMGLDESGGAHVELFCGHHYVSWRVEADAEEDWCADMEDALEFARDAARRTCDEWEPFDDDPRDQPVPDGAE